MCNVYMHTTTGAVYITTEDRRIKKQQLNHSLPWMVEHVLRLWQNVKVHAHVQEQGEDKALTSDAQ